MRRFAAKLANLFRSRSAERELAREIESYLAMLQEDFERRGLSPEDAKLAARRAYGGVEQAKELHREARSFQWIEHLFKDLRYGTRSLLRTPAFTAIAVLALALGIGANMALLGVVNAVLLRPLAYRQPDQLVTILHNDRGPVATANYLDWRDQSRSFTAMGAADYWSPNLRSSDPSDSNPAEHLYALKVTQNLLPLLGIEPLMGRWFIAGEDQDGADHEVILSYRLWERRFNLDRNVLGRQVTLGWRALHSGWRHAARFQVCALLGHARGVVGARCLGQYSSPAGRQPFAGFRPSAAQCYARTSAGRYRRCYRPSRKRISRH